MRRTLLIILTFFFSVHSFAGPLPKDPLKKEEKVEEEKLTPEEQRDLVEEQQEAFGQGSTPTLPQRESNTKRNLIMLLVSLFTAFAGISAVSSKPGHGPSSS